MLLETKTQEEYGYLPSAWGEKSEKKICVRCDYCGVDYTVTPKARFKAHKTIKKDACNLCRFKKREEVCLAKYGVKNSSQRKEIRDKVSTVDLDSFKIKILKMYDEGYSILYICDKLKLPNSSVWRRMKEWGVQINKDKNKDRLKKTLIERYGEDYQEKINQKLIATSQERYGVDYVFQSEEVKEKIKTSLIKKYGVSHIMKIPGVAKKIAQKGIKTKIKNGDILIHDKKTVIDIAKERGFSASRFYALVKTYGIEKAITLDPHQSSLETTMEDWLISEGLEYEKQFRIDKKRADFKIDNLICEVDGIYWHSEQYKERRYHVEKRQLYIDNGYTPLFFRSDEVLNKFPIVQSIILNKLGKSKRIFARKCEVKRVQREEGRDFIEENHLMGSIKKGTFFGLYYEGELTSIMSIYRKKGDLYEISRMCHKKGVGVTGGFSKLLSFIKKNTPEMKSLMTFIDLRYGQGDYLSSMGFTQQKTHLSFKWTDGTNTFHRMAFPASTGYEKGLFKIFDCGQARWEKEWCIL